MSSSAPVRKALLVLGICGALVVVCCGGAWLLAPQEARDVMRLSSGFGPFYASLQKDLRSGAHAELGQSGGKWVLRIGLDPGDTLTPERAVEVQDYAWRLFVQSWERGGVPLDQISVGRAVHDTMFTVRIEGDEDYAVSVDELVRRTGVARPLPGAFAFEDDEAPAVGDD